MGEDDVIILKTIHTPSMRDFDRMIAKARRQARQAGMKRSDITAAVSPGPSGKMKVVVDTNVFISGVFFTGPPHQILDAWRRGSVHIVVGTRNSH